MCPASLSPPQLGHYCGVDVQDAELLSDKNWKGQKCPGMKTSDVIMGMPRPAQAGLPPWAWPHKCPTAPPALHTQKCYWVPWKNTGKCFAKYTIVLWIWLACCAVEGKNLQRQQNLNMAWVHSGCGGGLSLLTNPAEQYWHPLHRDCKGKFTPLCTLKIEAET